MRYLKSLWLSICAALAFSMVMVGTAAAALPAAVGTAITALEVDGLALFDLIWPVVISLTAAVILMKIFKRGASKI